MSRRPVTGIKLGIALVEHFKAQATKPPDELVLLVHPLNRHIVEELFVFGALDADPSAKPHRPSRRRDLLDEKSTGDPKKSTTKNKKHPDFKKPLAKALEYGEQIIREKWEPRHESDLVGLYAALHLHTYGVEALELRAEYGAAVSCCRKLLREEFQPKAGVSAPLELQRYLAWCFQRARKWKAQKEKDGEDVVRLAWRTVFHSRKWLVDYKASGR